MTPLLSTQQAGEVHSFPPPGHASSDSGREACLLDRIRAGDAQAFETLVHEYSGRMSAVARRLLRSEEDSADAVQEALLAALRSVACFKGQSTLWTWLYRIVVNICLMKLSCPSRRREVALANLLPAYIEPGRHGLGVSPESEQPYTRLARAETRAQVRTCIDRLPGAYRRVLLLRDIEELDTDETARRLGVSRAVVRVRLHRARQALRALLAPLLDPEGADGPVASCPD